MARFAYGSSPHRYRDNARRIAELVSCASSEWTELAAEIGASNLLTSKGCLYLYQTSKAFRAATSDIELRRGYGVSQEFLCANDVLQLEPKLPRFEGGGLFFPNAMNLTDPGQVMRLLSAAVQRTGVDFIKASATCITRERDGVRVAASPFEVRARTVVIAAGAHSRKLAAEIGDPVPLDTERGYHIEYDMAENLLSSDRSARRPKASISAQCEGVCALRGWLNLAVSRLLPTRTPASLGDEYAPYFSGTRRAEPHLAWLPVPFDAGFRACYPAFKGRAGHYPRLRAWAYRVDARATHRPLGQPLCSPPDPLLEHVYGLSNRIHPSELGLR